MLRIDAATLKSPVTRKEDAAVTEVATTRHVIDL